MKIRIKGLVTVMILGVVVAFTGSALAADLQPKSSAWLDNLKQNKKKPAQTTADDAAAYTRAGAMHSPGGFQRFPYRDVPFKPHHRVKSNTLTGQAIYATKDGYRIFKYLNCDSWGDVWLEMAIMDRAGHRVPFAWQECGPDCESGADCNTDNPIYVDISGDGRPEIKTRRMGELVEMHRVFLDSWELPLYVFQTTIVPDWVWTKMGPDKRDECKIRPDDRVDPRIDHPLTTHPTSHKGLEVKPKDKNKSIEP